jgi:hypothetical protein
MVLQKRAIKVADNQRKGIIMVTGDRSAVMFCGWKEAKSHSRD